MKRATTLSREWTEWKGGARNYGDADIYSRALFAVRAMYRHVLCHLKLLVTRRDESWKGRGLFLRKIGNTALKVTARYWPSLERSNKFRIVDRANAIPGRTEPPCKHRVVSTSRAVIGGE